MKQYLLLVSLLIILAATFWQVPQPEQVKVVPYPVIRRVDWITERTVEVIKEVPIETRIYNNVEVPVYIDREVIRYRAANATPLELATVYSAIDYGIMVHRFYAENPGVGGVYGDVSFNKIWWDNYLLIKDLLDRAYKERE